MAAGERFGLVSGGWRAGKSEIAAVKLFSRLPCAPSGLFWVVGPDYEQARPEFDAIHRMASLLGGVQELSRPQQGPCTLMLVDGTRIVTKSSSDPETLGGLAPDGVLMVEAAQHPYEAMLNLRGRVAEKRGWLFLSGTLRPPKAVQVYRWFAQVWREWQTDNVFGGISWSLPSWSNTAVFPGGRDDPEIKRLEATFPPALFMERFGGEPVALRGLVLPEFTPTIHQRYRFPQWQTSFQEFDFEAQLPVAAGVTTVEAWQRDTAGGWPERVEGPSARRVPVQLWVDPGYGHYYAVAAVQIIGREVWVIDQVYHKGRYTEEVIDECAGRDWWGNIRSAIFDYYGGRQHHNAPSEMERWRKYCQEKHSSRFEIRANPVRIDPGYSRHRAVLHATLAYEQRGQELEPRLYIDPKLTSLTGGIIDGEDWPGEYNIHVYPTDSEGNILRENPVDRFNDMIKAINYGLWANFGAVEPRGGPNGGLQSVKVSVG